PALSVKTSNEREKLIFVAIDALHPGYLDLDSKGMPGGSDGNWLMPNIRAFLTKSMWYRDAKAFLPAATDMNHLNALAGTSTAQTGIIGVWAQPTGWDEEGRAVIAPTSLSFARDDQGRSVDTLFHVWKRKYPDSKTMLITGKEWVGEMFRQERPGTAVDILATGPNHPDYLEPPKREGLADPVTDRDAACDPESKRLGIFGGRLGLSDIWTRLYTGQRSLLTLQMEHFANHFPHDRWIVDSTLEIFRREDPDLAYILLAQCDDAGHCIGNASDPSEFEEALTPYKPPKGCEGKPEYQLVSKRNRLLYKEAILDVIRDVDIQFGRLMAGLEKQGVLGRSKVILLSDHAAVNHLSSMNFSSTDVMGLLKGAGLADDKTVYAFSVSSYGTLYWRGRKEKVSEAKKLLLKHKALNPQTGEMECPWWVLDRNDMKNGLEGICGPGELYHRYYIEVDRERSMIWPDLIILAKNGWQIPVYNGHVPNVGIKAPKWMWPWRVYNGGHGSVDTLPIVAAISVPGGRTGIQQKPIRIADLGVTAASLFGLELKSTTVGVDLSSDLA
ncbi:MAG TPA: alkaline phosphatase family protein, partial [Deltaproteobacteria bacterium]|nr:alkaline phosphatase family protein [Deltaproteobacteria bacterium]